MSNQSNVYSSGAVLDKAYGDSEIQSGVVIRDSIVPNSTVTNLVSSKQQGARIYPAYLSDLTVTSSVRPTVGRQWPRKIK